MRALRPSLRRLSQVPSQRLKGRFLELPTLDSDSELRPLWLQAGLLVIRNLDLSPSAFAELSARFGPLGPAPYGRQHATLGPGGCVLRIGNVRDETGNLIAQPSSSKAQVLAEDGSCQYRPADRLPVWHTDGTFKEVPEAGTALYCVQAPPTGGATCFADAAAAWDALPELQKQRLRNLECICSLAHHDAKIRRRNPDYPMSQTRQRQRVPLALEHPETKRVALYGINSSTCWIVERGQEICSKRLEWLEESGEEDGSVEMLQELLVHATAPEFTVVWQWQPGDFAICDTRSTLHCATSYDERYLREMWRTSIMP